MLLRAGAALAAAGGDKGNELQEARDTQGRKVLTAHARVAPLRWLVFVEAPGRDERVSGGAHVRRRAPVSKRRQMPKRAMRFRIMSPRSL
jgi:hypothetical protein